MRPPYSFGISQEDERTEAAALDLPGGRVLSIASAGDMALSLLALGADRVVATDIDLGQVCLGELKLATVRVLDREDAIRFLGFLPASSRDRARWLALILPHLPGPARDFWNRHRRDAFRGAIWSGRYERYLRVLRALLTPLAGRAFRRLTESATPDEQARVYAAAFDRPVMRAAFRVAFAPRLYARRGLDPQGLQHRPDTSSLGGQFFDRFRATCLGSPARLNPLLQLHVLGRVRDRDVVPEYLTARGFRAVRERCGRVSFVHAAVSDHLAASARGAYDRFHLSNVPDWLTVRGFDELLALIADRAARPTRLVWRSLHVNHALPDSVRARICVDSARGDVLQARDRFPIYRISAAAIDT